jgi:hypothetical protein
VTRALARLACGALVAMLAVGGSAGATAAAATSNPKDVARAGVLRRSDFPAGWEQHPRQSSSDNELDNRAAKITSCKPFLAFTKANKKNPRATSPNFDLDQADVNNTVSVFPSATKATAAMQTFTDTRLPGCLEKLYAAESTAQLAKTKKVAKQLQSVKVDIARLDGVQLGAEAIAYQGTVKVTLKDGTLTTIGLAVIAVRVDDAVAAYSYTADTDISAALQPAIVSSVSRLQHATAATSTT